MSTPSDVLQTLPALPRGEGSWGYDPARGKITLRHRWDGKAYTERGDTADDCLARRNRRRRDATVQAALVGDGTMGALLEAWFAHASRGKKQGTIRNYRWSIDHISRRIRPETSVTDLTVTAVEELWTSVADEGIVSGLATMRSHLGMALDFGERRDMIPSDIRQRLRSAEFPRLPPRGSGHRWFSLEDYATVRAHLLARGGTRNTLFLTMLLCGLRPGEALGLRWEHVDLENRTLRVEGTIERYGTTRGAYSTRLKTDHRHECAHRILPLPADLTLALQRLRLAALPTEHYVEQIAGPPLRADGFVFVEGVDARSRGQLTTDDAVWRHALKVAAAARLEHINPNGYRHSFASMCRHNGMPYEELAKLMGHKTTQMIIQTYGHSIKATSPSDIDRFLNTPKP
jgi:integrase